MKSFVWHELLLSFTFFRHWLVLWNYRCTETHMTVLLLWRTTDKLWYIHALALLPSHVSESISCDEANETGSEQNGAAYLQADSLIVTCVESAHLSRHCGSCSTNVASHVQLDNACRNEAALGTGLLIWTLFPKGVIQKQAEHCTDMQPQQPLCWPGNHVGLQCISSSNSHDNLTRDWFQDNSMLSYLCKTLECLCEGIIWLLNRCSAYIWMDKMNESLHVSGLYLAYTAALQHILQKLLLTDLGWTLECCFDYWSRCWSALPSELVPGRASVACLSPKISLYSLGSTLSIGMTTNANMAKPAASATHLISPYCYCIAVSKSIIKLS